MKRCQIETTVFKPSEHISIHSFLSNINTSGESDSTVEDDAIQLFRYFIQALSKVALSYQVTTEKKDHPQEWKVTTYYQVASYLLEMYLTNDGNFETEAEVKSFKEPAGMAAAQYYEHLWEKPLRCGMDSDARLEIIFIEGLHSSISYSIFTYGGSEEEFTVQNLMPQMTSLFWLHESSHCPMICVQEDTIRR